MSWISRMYKKFGVSGRSARSRRSGRNVHEVQRVSDIQRPTNSIAQYFNLDSENDPLYLLFLNKMLHCVNVDSTAYLAVGGRDTFTHEKHSNPLSSSNYE